MDFLAVLHKENQLFDFVTKNGILYKKSLKLREEDMDSVFCASCGTLLGKGQSECPFCKMPRTESKIKNEVILKSAPAQPVQEEFPETLFQGSTTQSQKIEVQPDTKWENKADFTATIQKEMPVYINPTGSEGNIERLRLSETILLLLAGLVPFIGTIGLLIAAFAGDETKKNRKTLARGILIVQSIIVVLWVVLWAFMGSFFFEESFLFWILWWLLFEKIS